MFWSGIWLLKGLSLFQQMELIITHQRFHGGLQMRPGIIAPGRVEKVLVEIGSILQLLEEQIHIVFK